MEFAEIEFERKGKERLMKHEVRRTSEKGEKKKEFAEIEFERTGKERPMKHEVPRTSEKGGKNESRDRCVGTHMRREVRRTSGEKKRKRNGSRIPALTPSAPPDPSRSLGSSVSKRLIKSLVSFRKLTLVSVDVDVSGKNIFKTFSGVSA